MPKLLILIVLLAVSGCARAQPPQMPSAAAACLGCHGPAGHSEGEIPSLAGLDKEEFIQAMADFKAGDGTIMNRIAPGYSDAEIETLAQYFANLKDAQ